jgi:phage terminase large subunit-like protein
MSDLNFPLLNWQREVFSDMTRFKVCVAGRRTGKTRFAAIMLIIKALECEHTDATVLYAAPTFAMAKVLMWDLIQELARPVLVKANINDGEITLVNGVKIRIRGADNPDSLRGYKLYYAVLDESKDMRETVWPLVIRPALSDLKGHALIIGTPEPGESQFRDQYELGLTGEDAEWKSWLFPTSCNELIDPKELESAKRTLSSQQYAQEYEADFNTYGQSVFKSEWLKFSPDEPKDGDYYIAVDPAGFEAVGDPNKKRHLDNTAIAVVKVTDDGKWWVKKIVLGRFDVRETAVQILMAIRSYRPIAVGVEKGSLARALMPYLQDLSRKNGIYAHIEHIVIGGSSKTNRITYALQGMYEHGRITHNSRENWDVFKKEYMNFPSKKVHDDAIDSLSLIANLVTTTYAKQEDGVREWEPLDEITGL